MEKIKKMMSEKKIYIIIVISIVVVLLIFRTTYAFFSSTDKSDEQKIETGELSIDFINGSTINATNLFPINSYTDEIDSSVTTFGVKNTGTVDSYIDISLNDITIDTELKTNQFKWRLYENNYLINEGGFKNVNTTMYLDRNIYLKRGNTNNYKLQIWIQDNNGGNQNQMQNKSLSAEIVIKGFSIITNQLSNLIVSNEHDGTKGFVKVNNEYIYNGPKSSASTMADDTINNNYVWFNGQMWRIMKQDNQGIKLITDYSVTSIAYSSGSSVWNTSYAKEWLENVFYPTVKRKSMLVNAKWCTMPQNPTEIEAYTISGVATEKVNSFTANTDCFSSTYNYSEGYVGLMTFEEYVNGLSTENQSGTIGGSYLDKDELSYTMTPYTANSTTNRVWYTFYGTPGHIEKRTYTATLGMGLRPTIYLDSEVMIAGGNGTKGNPYKIYGDSVGSENKTLNSRTSGEYVLYSGKKYRIVGTNENGTTKILQDANDGNKPFYKYDPTSNGGVNGDAGCYYYTDNGTKYVTGECQTKFDPSYPVTPGSAYNINGMNIGYYLNSASNSYLSTLQNSDWIVPSRWNRKIWTSGMHYNNNSSGYEDLLNTKIGLIKVGEMMSGNDINSYYWTITPWNASSYVAIVTSYGYVSNINSCSSYGVRPVFNLDSRIFISGGNGTTTNPYTLSYEDQ